MGLHAADRLIRPDRQINVIMRETWPQLPPGLKRTAGNIATIRIGVIAYAILLPAGFINKIVISTPEEFLRYLAGMTTVFGLLGLIAAIAILYVRVIRTAPAFVAAYMEIMPGFADRIEARYAERGLGDVFAPWIRSRRNIMTVLFGRLAARFSIKP